MSEDLFRVLTVCTGNICRSPFAERFLRHELERRLGATAASIEVGSAGTSGLTGWPMDEDASGVLAALGIDVGPHEARQVDASLIHSADLVLTATRDHRGAVLQLAPRASRRIFTMREFGRLAPLVDLAALPAAALAERLRAAVDEAAALRGVSGPGGDDDVGDPFRGGVALHRRVGDTMTAALSPVVELLCAVAAEPAPRSP